MFFLKFAHFLVGVVKNLESRSGSGRTAKDPDPEGPQRIRIRTESFRIHNNVSDACVNIFHHFSVSVLLLFCHQVRFAEWIDFNDARSSKVYLEFTYIVVLY